MMTRRNFVSLAVASGTAFCGTLSATEAPSKINFEVPGGACDSHVHVLDPARFPYSARRRYTPGTASVAQLTEMHAGLGMQRVIVVQNSVYGSDNRVVLDAIKQLGMQRARGVATLDEKATPHEIEALHRDGIRGIRLNLEVEGDHGIDAAASQLQEVARRIPAGWHVHLNVSLSVAAGLRRTITGMNSPVVLDHFAHANTPPGVTQHGFSDVISMIEARKAIVKLSAPYQISKLKDYADVAPVARAFVEAAPDQLIWGSDWPHTGGTNRRADQPIDVVEPFRSEDDAKNLNLLAEWAPDPAVRKLILVETPARLYGFS